MYDYEMRVLVTGGAGYVGGITAKLLLDSGHQVVVLDDLSTGHIESISYGFGFSTTRFTGFVETLLAKGFQ